MGLACTILLKKLYLIGKGFLWKNFLSSSKVPHLNGKSFFAKHDAELDLMKRDCPIQLSKESPSSDGLRRDSALSTQSKGFQNKSSKASRIVIEWSDGSVRSGKRSGKEYWQHTKRWSQGFLESYNAETDPETKAVMKDMGRIWIDGLLRKK